MTTTNEPKYRIENGRIVNRVSGEAIPDDEPIFILRARDCLAIHAFEGYIFALEDEPGTAEHLKAVKIRLKNFGDFSDQHPERMKVPDTTLTEDWRA